MMKYLIALSLCVVISACGSTNIAVNYDDPVYGSVGVTYRLPTRFAK